MNKKLKWHFSQLAIFYFDSNKLKTTRTTLRIVNNSFFSKFKVFALDLQNVSHMEYSL